MGFRPTRSCTFSTSQSPRVVRNWFAFRMLTSKFAAHRKGVHLWRISTSKKRFEPETFCAFWASTCALRHRSKQFLIPHRFRWLSTRRFSKPTCRPSPATRHWKDIVCRGFLPFSRTLIFFLLTLSLLWLFSLLLLHLSTSWKLNFWTSFDKTSLSRSLCNFYDLGLCDICCCFAQQAQHSVLPTDSLQDCASWVCNQQSFKGASTPSWNHVTNAEFLNHSQEIRNCLKWQSNNSLMAKNQSILSSLPEVTNASFGSGPGTPHLGKCYVHAECFVSF